MYIMSQQKISQFLEKIKRLTNLEKCEDPNYVRNKTNEKLRNEIIEEQKKLCWLCGCKTSVPIIHHIQPEGESKKENLVMLCPLCHQFVHWILKKYLNYRGTAGRPPF